MRPTCMFHHFPVSSPLLSLTCLSSPSPPLSSFHSSSPTSASTMRWPTRSYLVGVEPGVASAAARFNDVRRAYSAHHHHCLVLQIQVAINETMLLPSLPACHGQEEEEDATKLAPSTGGDAEGAQWGHDALPCQWPRHRLGAVEHVNVAPPGSHGACRRPSSASRRLLYIHLGSQWPSSLVHRSLVTATAAITGRKHHPSDGIVAMSDKDGPLWRGAPRRRSWPMGKKERKKK